MKYILLILFGVSKHFRDEIAYHPSSLPNWEWLTANRWETRSWFLKNPFSMFLDGWHFMEFVNVYSFCLIFAIIVQTKYKCNWCFMLGVSIAAYILIGLFHSLLDGSLL